jgi:peptidyl-prolyl cis-trans isomerase SurA
MRIAAIAPTLFAAITVWIPAPAQAQTTPTAPPPAALVSPAQKKAASQAAQKAAATQQSGTVPQTDTPVVLDSVVAIVNGDVLLQSDVEQERRLESLQLLPADQNTDARAAQHLITRTLILQQMKQQGQMVPQITDADVNKVLDEMKHQLPGCLPTRCTTAQGWSDYLAERSLTPDEVAADWRLRLQILDYLNLRFRTGVRVPRSQIRDYYQKTLVPQFQAKHETPPPLKSLSSRIQDLLLQQQVTQQINDWEATLLQQGSVRILVPAYGQSSAAGEDDDDMPGGA